MTAEQRACAVAIRQGIGSHDVGEVRVGIRRVSEAKARDLAQARAPDLVAQAEQEGFQPHVGCAGGFLAGTWTPEVERRDRQDTVRLLATSQRRERPAAANVCDKVIARPCESFWREARAFHADHVREEVTPRRLPQRGVHTALIDFVTVATATDACEHRRDVCIRQPQRGTKALAVRLLIERQIDCAGLRRETALVSRVLGAIARALGGRIVRRCAEAQELQAVGVVLRVELRAELLRTFIRRRAGGRTEHDQAFDRPGEIRGGERNTQPHACCFRLVEIHHPAHALIDCRLIAGDLGRGISVDLRIGADSEIRPNVATDRRSNDAPGRVHDRDPATRQQACLRCTSPRRILALWHDIDSWKLRLAPSLPSPARGGGLGWGPVRRTQHPRDPRCPLRIVSLRQLPPRILLRLRVGPREEYLRPIVLTPGLLCLRQLLFVRIDMNPVRVYAHAQLAAAVRLREETRFETNGKQRERPIRLAQLDQHLRQWRRNDRRRR